MNKQVLVIGAGVSGLSTAIVLLEKGYNVTIVTVASIEKCNVNDPTFASPKAGAFWDSPPKSSNRIYEELTYKTLLKIARDTPECGIRLLPDFVYARNTKEPWFKDVVEDFRYLTKEELPAGLASGYTHITTCINTSKYLAFLLKKCKRLGGKIEYVAKPILSQEIPSLCQRYQTNIVFNCTGLGARDFANDASVYPIRGQLAIAKLPKGVNADFAFKVNDDAWPEATGSYMIPRDDGTVIFGGCYNRGDYEMAERPLDLEGIFKRALVVTGRDSPLGKAILNGQIQVEKCTVGLRPGRSDGIRVEVEETSKFKLVHNYGHGAYGFQTSWGTAINAVEMMERSQITAKL